MVSACSDWIITDGTANDCILAYVNDLKRMMETWTIPLEHNKYENIVFSLTDIIMHEQPIMKALRSNASNRIPDATSTHKLVRLSDEYDATAFDILAYDWNGDMTCSFMGLIITEYIGISLNSYMLNVIRTGFRRMLAMCINVFH